MLIYAVNKCSKISRSGSKPVGVSTSIGVTCSSVEVPVAGMMSWASATGAVDIVPADIAAIAVVTPGAIIAAADDNDVAAVSVDGTPIAPDGMPELASAGVFSATAAASGAEAAAGGWAAAGTWLLSLVCLASTRKPPLQHRSR